METKKMNFKKIGSVLLASILLVCMVFTWTGERVNAANGITVSFMVQRRQKFMLANEDVTVEPGLAKEYGYKNDDSIGENEVSLLDAMVAAHKKTYGDAFTKETAKEYFVVSGGFITRAFQDDDYNISYAVNEKTPMNGDAYATVADFKMHDKDHVDFFYYQDTKAYSDLISYFTQNDAVVNAITVKADEKITVGLKGFSVFDSETHMALENAKITTINANKDQDVMPDVVTDKNGQAQFSFSKAGTYLVSAIPTDNSKVFASPCLKVTVTKEETPVPTVTPTVAPTAAPTPTVAPTVAPTTAPETYVTLENPTRKGYLFKGWYTDSKFTNKVTKVKTSEYGKIKLYKKWEKVTVKKVTVKSVKNNKSKVAKASWKKVNKADGYQVTYSVNKNFKKSKKNVTVKATNKQISKLAKNKTYYVKVRAYRYDSKKNKVYGAYSKVVKVKIKK